MAEVNGPAPVALDDEAWKRQVADDDQAIRRITSDERGSALGEEFHSFMEGATIDQRGKADDAVDFEDFDLSDDDLPDDEDNIGATSGDVPALTDDGGTSNDTDDLFGDPHESSPMDVLRPELRSSPHPLDADGDHARLSLTGRDSMDDLRDLNFDHDTQIRDDTNQDPDIPAPPESEELLVKLQWPGFEKDKILNWNELLRPKQATWISRRPAKPPKPLIPNKLTLDLEADQEKLFRIPGTATNPVWQKMKDAEAKGLVCCEEPEPLEQADLEVFHIDGDSDSELVGGFTLRDIATLCDDWDSMIKAGDATPVQLSEVSGNRQPVKDGPDEEALWDEMFLEQPAAKRRKTEPPHGLPEIPRFTAPNFDNFVEATAKLGKRVILDKNDPYILIDDVESERTAKRRKVQHKLVRMANGQLGREMNQRFNFSSDLAYEALKENHSNKIRATTAHIPVEHSMPARRLQWPYYKVKLGASEPHSYHRPPLQTRKMAYQTIRFSKANVHKRKAFKGKRTAEVYKASKDLTLNDNSTAVLLEYCEEIPTVLSNFGMGCKIINYYRRSKGSEGRPDKRELGEPYILLPEDRSPFAIFGQVHPGEVVTTLHTQMYRAPIFRHTPRSTDFLIGRSSTGVGGYTWYLRNIDHMFVVGQNFPSLEVPGPHSRRVTNIAKNRLKMVSYRLMKKSDNVTLSDITRHIADSTESQNRQKLKEFLVFHKDTKTWGLPEGEEMMTEAGIRALVRPEEVCLLDAMQVGYHELENGGYEASGDLVKDEDNKDVDLNLDDAPPDAIASKMTPWKTTKVFIDASHGKAMLSVHGPGDPTGRGLGISFLKTSMKGGFLEQLHGPLATSADAIERQKKANGGHMYNVKDQEKLYVEAITDVWNRQRANLEDTMEHEDNDVQVQEDEDDRFNVQNQPAATPAATEGMSQISRSAASALSHRKLRITRQIRKSDGSTDTVTELVHDPIVIAQYMKRRRQLNIAAIDIYNYQPTGDEEQDQLAKELMDKEHERLHKNQDRRQKREKAKKLEKKGKSGDADVGGMSPEPSTEKGTGTTRKCANCGQVGHIKTNKKCAYLPKTFDFLAQDLPPQPDSLFSHPISPPNSLSQPV